MFNMIGHKVTLRGVRPDDEFPLGMASIEDVAMVVIGEDMGEALLLAFGHAGGVLYRDPDIDPELLSEYEAAARAINKAVEREQAQAAAEVGS